MNINFFIKMTHPKTQVRLERAVVAEKIEVLDLIGFSKPCLLFCDLVDKGRCFTNVEKVFPSTEEVIGSHLIAVYPSQKYASLDVRKSFNPVSTFCLSILEIDNSPPTFHDPVFCSFMITAR